MYFLFSDIQKLTKAVRDDGCMPPEMLGFSIPDPITIFKKDMEFILAPLACDGSLKADFTDNSVFVVIVVA